MEALNARYDWRFLTIFTTRPSRQKETYKITLSIEEFEQEVQNERIIFANNCYQNFYGVSKSDLLIATSSTNPVWMWDFSIVNQHQTRDLPNTKRFVILPEDESQLIYQIYKSNRLVRENFILEEYRRYYSNFNQGLELNLDAFCLINKRNSMDKNLEIIKEIVSNFD